MNESRKKAHTSPTAQYTLVNIRGKNSIDANPLPVPGTSGSAHIKLSSDMHDCGVEIEAEELRAGVRMGNNVMKS